ncbi:MAG: phosphoenolpyruvate synthase, partial [Actinobacteria bacterium]|nr:phosphoenolpyruvate synthase [Actinomycetota bacterium]
MHYVLGLDEIARTQQSVVGGKGANLAELSRIEGVRVPDGFCVATDAFRRIVAETPAVRDGIDQLSRLGPDDRDAIRERSAAIRHAIEATDLPDDLAAAITAALTRLGVDATCAVRSSATAEDLPTASFAGQQDSYLNIVGPASVREHVRRCWASLFTERAVAYRRRNGFDDHRVQMAVVVQRMVDADTAGILFTADPVTSDRRVVCVEAVRGLGEPLVSGRVEGDVYTVRDDEIVTRAVGTEPVLTDAQVLRLARLGRHVEAHFGRPQDIEWCLVDDDVQLVQSRPITTLFPVPEAGDQDRHVYVSVGHQQMMTDPFTPLGLSVWQLTTPRPMAEAGGRLFVDIGPALATPAGQAGLFATLGKSDP